MTDVVDLGKVREDRDKTYRRLLCACGNCTYELRADGGIVCAQCFSPVTEAREWWSPEDLMEIPWREGGEHPDSLKSSTADLAERRMKARAAMPEVSWIALGTDDGSIAAWTRNAFETGDQRDWLRRKMAWALDALLAEKAHTP